jgi:hypothetical protein
LYYSRSTLNRTVYSIIQESGKKGDLL